MGIVVAKIGDIDMQGNKILYIPQKKYLVNGYSKLALLINNKGLLNICQIRSAFKTADNKLIFSKMGRTVSFSLKGGGKKYMVDDQVGRNIRYFKVDYDAFGNLYGSSVLVKKATGEETKEGSSFIWIPALWVKVIKREYYAARRKYK